MTMKKQAEKLYEKILTLVENHTGTTTTFLSDLDDAGGQMFGTKFHGVYPSDRIPQLSKNKPYCILNCDKSNMPGSHWVALCYRTKNTSLFYDSFGREPKEVIPSVFDGLNGHIESTEDDYEQDVSESNCGARCLAWLAVCDQCGLEAAKFI